jgi:holo-ACP synthase CitX
MPDRAADILADREERSRWIQEHVASDRTVVSVHANLPGSDKNLPQAGLIVAWISAALPFSAEKTAFHAGSDGPGRLFVLEENSETIKKRCVEIEESDPLGRFADLDVFGPSGRPLSREVMRKCYLCDRPAFVCGREKTHSEGELSGFLVGETNRCLTHFVSESVDSAILDELNLDPKFGLVTPTSSGSHPDMDYDLMIRAAAGIKPFLLEMYRRGFSGAENPEPFFSSLRPLGIEAERKMLEVTGGVNAYKGLIFSLGLILAAAGLRMSRVNSRETLFDIVRQMTRSLPEEMEGPGDTAGIRAWHEHRLGGARKEAFLGFPSVQKALPCLEVPGKAGLTLALLSLIGSLEDTVLWKRSGSMEAYREVREKMGAIRHYDPREIREVTEWCVSRKLSFGGAADLLTVTAFLHRFAARFPDFVQEDREPFPLSKSVKKSHSGQ